MGKLSSLSRTLSMLVRHASNNMEILNGICYELKCAADSNIIIVSTDGKLVSAEFLPDGSEFLPLKTLPEGSYIETQLNDQLNNITDTAQGIVFEQLRKQAEADSEPCNAIVIPITIANTRDGTLLMFKKNRFSDNENIAAEFCAAFIALICRYMREDRDAAADRRLNIVKSALSTLSYSELNAVLHIFHVLDGNEGLVVAAKIADQVGITRSVIVNALRKLESAGVIETNSLGMKGTYIKVLNSIFIEELNKLGRV